MRKPRLADGQKKKKKSGPYDKYDPQKVHNSLTAGTLRGPGKLAIPPVLFAKKDESEAVGVFSSTHWIVVVALADKKLPCCSHHPSW